MSDRTSGVYRRPMSTTLESKAAVVRDLAAAVASGELSPRQVAEKLEMLARGLEEDAGAVLALEARHG